MPYNELVERLIGLVQTQNAASFFVSGPPSSGKTYLLAQLARTLPSLIAGSVVIGPVSLSRDGLPALGYSLMRLCHEAGFINQLPSSEQSDNLVSTWQWFKEHGHFSPGHCFLVFIDMEQCEQYDFNSLAYLFSATRYLEHAWNQEKVHLLVVIAGSWDHVDLMIHYDHIQTSFPYTEASNYVIWQGITVDEITRLLKHRYPNDKHHDRYGHWLYELTGGHPGAIIDILDKIHNPSLSVENILKATKLSAQSGQVSDSLCSLWAKLPATSLDLVAKLLQQRYIMSKGLPDSVKKLEQVNLTRRYQSGNQFYICFHSWYIELVIRFHATRLNILTDMVSSIPIDDLIPPVSTLNLEGYRLINNIETLVRNFLSIQLHKKATSTNLLATNQVFAEMHQEAITWRNESQRLGLPTQLNPLLVYTSTRWLAGSIRALGRTLNTKEWLLIADSLNDLAPLRDAIMHNQIVDELALQRLYLLQERVYDAISKTV